MSTPPAKFANLVSRPLDLRRSRLETMLNPRSVALIGASEKPNSVGQTIMQNLLSFDGAVYPINPERPTVFNVKAFPSIGDAPGPVDLAVIATPAVTVPGLISECAAAGVKG